MISIRCHRQNLLDLMVAFPWTFIENALSNNLLYICEGSLSPTNSQRCPIERPKWHFVSLHAESSLMLCSQLLYHDDAMKWKHFPRYWPFCVQRPVTRMLMFSLICAWIKAWVKNREAGNLRHHRAHYDVIVMMKYGVGGRNCTALTRPMITVIATRIKARKL